MKQLALVLCAASLSAAPVTLATAICGDQIITHELDARCGTGTGGTPLGYEVWSQIGAYGGSVYSWGVVNNFDPPYDTIVVQSLVEITDQLEFAGIGQGILRVNYTAWRTGYIGSASTIDLRVGSTTAGLLTPIVGSLDDYADFPILLGQPQELYLRIATLPLDVGASGLGGPSLGVIFSIDSMTLLTQVPEPSTFVFGGLGVILFGMIKPRR